MSDVDLERIEELLLEERQRTLHDLQEAEEEEEEGQRESSGEISRAPSHMADAGSDTQEAEKDFAIMTRNSDQLAQIDEALRLLRNDPDTYLTCGECGERIQEERLEIVPWTRRCASCANQGEGRGTEPPSAQGSR
ncbi:MAG: TraR/DksA C4-type zinc finger protein [Longimicrobiales bacterium]|nr:TraR/DksA C4-type zinc finger protein [Longimicrobiales bacterium]